MAFKIVVECTSCGVQTTVTVEELTNLNDVRCPECDYQPEPEPECMSKAERDERYRLQYKANGYSWLGKEPTMWQGELE